MNKVTFEAIVAVAGVPTRNGHVYTKEALEKAAADFNDRAAKRGGALHGELAMPGLQRPLSPTGQIDIGETFHIDERHVSHVYSNARLDEDGSMKVSAVLLDTPDGKLVEEFMERTQNGTQPVFSIRGHIPRGISKDKITNIIPVSIDIVDVK